MKKINNSNKKETLLLNEVENDKLYELVITTLSGFYRYKTGDIIKTIKNNQNENYLNFVLGKSY